MHVGAVFPQTEIGGDREAISAFVTAVEETGFDLLLAYDHVLGADPDDPEFDGPYDNDDPFHEPLTLFSYLAGVTEDLTLVTGILILPQRQTALVAKQAAQIDVLTGGRLRLGVGVGWNAREYAALGRDFGTRGRRIEEQIDVLRRLWTDDVVEFDGRFHRLPAVGINPLPVQRPIPLWMGGEAPAVLRRAGRQADGWLPPGHWKRLDRELGEIEAKLETIREAATAAGRSMDEFRIVVRMAPEGDPERWVDRARAWRDLGATHILADTVRQGLEVDEHIERMETFYERMAAAGLTTE